MKEESKATVKCDKKPKVKPRNIYKVIKKRDVLILTASSVVH